MRSYDEIPSALSTLRRARAAPLPLTQYSTEQLRDLDWKILQHEFAVEVEVFIRMQL